MTLFDYKDRELNTRRNQIIDTFGLIFTIIFTMECVIKIIAYGFIFHKKSYLRDSWNVIDFFVVMLGLFELSFSGYNMKALRTLRVLRPLKSINAIPSLRRLVTALIRSLPDFGNVAMFLFFIFILFGILGLHQFSDAFYFHCRKTERPVNATYWSTSDVTRLCATNVLGMYECPGSQVCGSPYEFGMEELAREEVKRVQYNYGITTFDNIAVSMLTVFQVITMDGWTAILYNMMDSTNVVISIVYFCSLILLGSFFLLNLILAVVQESYVNIQSEELVKDFQQNMKIVNSIIEQLYIDAAEFVTQEGDEEEDYDEEENSVESEQLGANIEAQNKQEVADKFMSIYQEKLNLNSSASKLVQNEDGTMKKAPTRQLSKRAMHVTKRQDKADQRNPKIFLDHCLEEFYAIGNIIQTQHIKEVDMVKFVLSQRIQNAEKTSIAQLHILKRHKVVSDLEQKKAQQLQLVEIRSRNNQFYENCYLLAMNDYFNLFIIVTIIVNTCFLASYRYPDQPISNQTMETFNIIFSFIFFIEMLIKLLAFGVKGYFLDSFNTFDMVVVLISVLDITANFGGLSIGQGIAIVQVFRGFRLLRIFKLARNWKTFHDLLKTIGRTMKDIRDFSILVLLFIVIYSLLGMELYGEKIKINELDELDPQASSPQSNFDNIVEAFASVFIVLANDGWSPIFFNHYRFSSSIAAIFYFVSMLMLGQFILLNLFLAVMLQNFEEDSVDQELEKKKRRRKKHNEKQNYFVIKISQFFKFLKKKLCQNNNKKFNNHERKQLYRFLKALKSRGGFFENVKIPKKPDGVALGIFPADSCFREKVFDLVNDPRFDKVILLMILISSVLLAMENPLNNPESSFNQVLFYLDVVFTSCFGLECLIKIVSYGFFFNGEESYLKSSYNCLDFFIVIISVFSLSFQNANLGFLKILRLLRILRPLRVISRNEGLKVALSALFMAMPNIANVSIVSGLFMLIFSIIGVFYFNGTFYRCDYYIPTEEIVHKWQCINLGGMWNREHFHFDDVTDAMISFFQIATTAGWAQNMYTGISKTKPDYVPVDKSASEWLLFFVLFIILGSFFIQNLFVGIVITTFNREKERLGKSYLMTGQQKEWIDIKLLMVRTKPKSIIESHENKIRQFALEIARYPRFEGFIMGCIILNTLVLVLKWTNNPVEVQIATEVVNYILAGVFTLEAIVKITAFGSQYFKDGWNNFDFSIVCGTIVGVVITFTTKYALGPQATIIRSFRIFRVFRLIRRAKSLRLMFQTFIVTLPSLMNIGALLGLLLYIYAVLGVNLFATIKHSSMVDRYANFQNLKNAFITLIRSATGENWHEIMWALQRDSRLDYQCIQNPSYDDFAQASREYKAQNGENYPGGVPVGCGGMTAVAYFISYRIVVEMIFLNLFIAIILQGFDDTNKQENSVLNNDIAEHFTEIWAKFDPKGTSTIPVSEFEDFLFKLGSPLGWTSKYKDNQRRRDKFIEKLKLVKYNEFKNYRFLEVLEALTLRAFIFRQIDEKNIKAEKLGSAVNEENQKIISPAQYLRRQIQKKMNFKTPSTVAEKMKESFVKEFEKLSQRADEIQAIKFIQDQERKRKDKLEGINSLHYDAARKILKFWRRKKAAEKKKAQQEQKEQVQQRNQEIFNEVERTGKSTQQLNSRQGQVNLIVQDIERGEEEEKKEEYQGTLHFSQLVQMTRENEERKRRESQAYQEEDQQASVMNRQQANFENSENPSERVLLHADSHNNQDPLIQSISGSSEQESNQMGPFLGIEPEPESDRNDFQLNRFKPQVEEFQIEEKPVKLEANKIMGRTLHFKRFKTKKEFMKKKLPKKEEDIAKIRNLKDFDSETSAFEEEKKQNKTGSKKKKKKKILSKNFKSKKVLKTLKQNNEDSGMEFDGVGMESFSKLQLNKESCEFESKGNQFQ